MNVTKGNVDIKVPPDAHSKEIWRYGIGIPFQLTSSKGAIFCNIHLEYGATYDFEAGTDLIIFDDISNISSKEAIPINRNHEEINPNTGKLSIMVKYPVIGGFVPRDAKLTDKSPHPHAGTGFGISEVVPFDAKTYQMDFTYRFQELFQFAYNGKDFHILDKERIISGKFPGLNPGLTSAIPDGEDLLFASTDSTKGVGVARWKHNAKGWYNHSFSPVTIQDTHEPSLIRDLDGALLFTTRIGDDIQIWRSYDDALTWKQIINKKGVRSNSPVTLNQAVDGTPYVASDISQEIINDSAREILGIWPLNAKRTGLKPVIIARDCRVEFGSPPGGSSWVCDHPSAATIKLSDGKWHNILAYRILELAEIQRWWLRRGTETPTPQTGCYIEEVYSTGKVIPTWNF
jgi:hypothetical protein